MSASREKKQRQGAVPTEQKIQAQEKAVAYKKKVKRYTVIGVVAAVLVAALLFWDSGMIQRSQTAVTVGEYDYSVGEISYFYQQIRYNSFMYYYAFGVTPPSDSDVMDEESGQTYREYFLDQVLESVTEVTALYDEALAAGWSESDVSDTVASEIEEVKASASSNGYSYSAFLRAQYGNYMTTSTFKSILTKVTLANEYGNAHTDELTYSDDEIQAYYNEHKDDLDTYVYSTLLITPEEVATTDADGNDLGLTDEELSNLKAEALENAKAVADEILAELKGGASVDTLAVKYGIDSSDVRDHNTAVGSSLSSTYSEELFAMADGDASMVAYGTTGYYVVTLHERKLVDDYTADVRHILISAETTTDEDGNTVAPNDEAWAAAKEKAESVLAEYQAGEQTAQAFGDLAEKYSADSGSNTNGGLYEGIAQGNFVSEFDSWMFDSARASGDVDLIQHVAGEDDSNVYYGYHIVYYVGKGNPTWMNTADSALRSAESSEWLDALAGQYTAELASGAKYVAD